MRFSRPPLLPLLVAAYLGLTWYSLRQSSLPTQTCQRGAQECVHPMVVSGNNISIQLFLYLESESDAAHKIWTPVETCLLRFSIPASNQLPKEVTNDQNCTIVLPEFARRRWSERESIQGGPLQAKFRFRLEQEGGLGPVVAEVPLSLTTLVTNTGSVWSSNPGTSQVRKLLEPVPTEMPSYSNHKYVPFLKYGSQPLLLRFVADTATYGGPPPYYRGDGSKIRAVKSNRSAYYPMIYIDDNALQRSAFREIAPPSEMMNKPPVVLRVQFSSLSPVRDVLNKQVTMALSSVETLLHGDELDEFRYWLRDERLYRFLLTQLISLVHLWLDYLAFRDEVRFYRGKSDLVGVSISSIVTRLVCSGIIFLYLLDGGGTSWIVLLSVFSNGTVEAWKVWKILCPVRIPTFPFFSMHQTQSPGEHETAQYDRIATTHMLLFFAPLLIGWALYALKNYAYTSWYSWFISNMANGVYTFGFISLCPQLYVNYRLKSVAHLPWKVFLYKIFNTFVDDAFAFLIDMPWKHRIMTLRDDVVFVLFLAQAWMYRVDKSRVNEYGYSYDDKKPQNHSIKDKDD